MRNSCRRLGRLDEVGGDDHGAGSGRTADWFISSPRSSRFTVEVRTSSAAISPASTVLPIPTSSAIRIRTVSWRRASMSGTYW